MSEHGNPPDWAILLVWWLDEQFEHIRRLIVTLHDDVAALTQAVADATSRVDAEIADLEAKIAAGTVAPEDLDAIKAATAELATLAAPVPAPEPVPVDQPPPA